MGPRIIRWARTRRYLCMGNARFTEHGINARIRRFVTPPFLDYQTFIARRALNATLCDDLKEHAFPYVFSYGRTAFNVRFSHFSICTLSTIVSPARETNEFFDSTVTGRTLGKYPLSRGERASTCPHQKLTRSDVQPVEVADHEAFSCCCS